MEITGAPARLRSLPSWLIGQLAIHSARISDNRLAEDSVRRAHYALLATLDEFGPDSQAALSVRCGIYRSDLVALVNELERTGFVRRERDHVDRRRNLVTITEAGRGELARLDRAIADLQDELFGGLSEAERRQLVGLLAMALERHSG